TKIASALGALTTDDIPAGTLNLYYTSSLFDADLASKDTDDLAQGTTNLFSQWSPIAGGIAYTGNTSITGNLSLTGDLTSDTLSTGSLTATSATISSFTSNGGLLYTNASGVLQQLATGSAGQCLVSTGGIPT